MSIKYTTDGKKVRVIGNLNTKEIIVQEIYVDESGAEISAGENFVVKSLLNKPAITWKEKDAKELEKRMGSMKLAWEKEYKEYRGEREKTRALIKNTIQVRNHFDEESLSLLEAFIAGEITHVVAKKWSSFEIIEFSKAVAMHEHDTWGHFEGLKLITLFGRAEGDLMWRVNRYSDGSGGDMEIFPCTSYEEAKEKIQKLLDQRVEKHGVGEGCLTAAKNYDLYLDPEKVKEYRAKILESKEKSLKSQNAAIAKLEEEIEGLLKK